MAIETLKTIKSWFKTGLKPTQAQFWSTWDSFRHKSEKVPVEDIEGIENLLTGDKIIPSGQFLIFKVYPNTADELEIGDSVIGYCEGNFLAEATYYGGDTSLMSSFTKPNNLVGRIISFVNNHVLTYELNGEVLQRSYSCGAYNGIVLMYKKPGMTEFSSVSPTGSYPELWISWLELTPGTIIKFRDTIGSLSDSKEFIV
ncbi:hypothetical protein [Flavobacterium pectinovorum]|uniref:Uncharacterized protein n=1 Tax=Flavobacterium pectinovorum TaxID=29533 RepID=A0A502EWN6_9FLAO|nr:hypothetical protein [Flavobacterium pectinovorum]TPG41967.1 hypothetical protein EAH81_06495 [Flavobacterium pectinovorum]